MNAVEIEVAVSDLVIQPLDRAELPFQLFDIFGDKEKTPVKIKTYYMSGVQNR